MRAARAERTRIQRSRPVSGVMFSIRFGRSVSRASLSSPNRASSSSRAVKAPSTAWAPGRLLADAARGRGVDVALHVLVEQEALLAEVVGSPCHRPHVGAVVRVPLLDRGSGIPGRLALGLRPLEVDLLARRVVSVVR